MSGWVRELEYAAEERDRLAAMRNEIIEECAKVAENDIGSIYQAQRIAAAIRALKPAADEKRAASK